MNHKKIFIITYCVFLMVVSTAIAKKTKSTEKNDNSYNGYQLVWSDEFNTDGPPDFVKWTYERGFVRNQELQWYQPDNAICKNGMLVIEARRERIKNPNYKPDSKNWMLNREYAEYTSSSLTTKGIYSRMFGRFEMRGRIDTRPGMWPAFWTLGDDGNWPSCGEIDIMEYYRGILLANAAWASEKPWSPIWDDSKKPITDFNDPNWSEKFHVWRMDWDANSIELYVDDLLLNTIDLQKTINQDGQNENPFHQPHYIILNLAIGGTQGGDPSETEFPAKYEIDYIRIYREQKK
jgi:beta-glucanase (GH16 family)